MRYGIRVGTRYPKRYRIGEERRPQGALFLVLLNDLRDDALDLPPVAMPAQAVRTRPAASPARRAALPCPAGETPAVFVFAAITRSRH